MIRQTRRIVERRPETNLGGCRDAPAWNGLGAVLGRAVALGAEDVEAAVQVHVDLAAVRAGDLDLVESFFVADLGLGDLTAADVGEGSLAGLLQRRAGDRLLGGVVVATRRLVLLARQQALLGHDGRPSA